jgi:hypothetical protein
MMRLCGGCQTKIQDNVRFCPECNAERAKRRTDSPHPDVRQHNVRRTAAASLFSAANVPTTGGHCTENETAHGLAPGVRLPLPR